MFKVGDKVVCIDNTQSNTTLVLGKTYTVAEVLEDCLVLMELPYDYLWYKRRFKLQSEIMNNTTPTEVMVEITQTEYDSLIEEINLLRELLAEANIKLADCLLDKMEDISIRIKTLNESIPEPTVLKPIDEYTMEDWEQARDEKWVFELYDGNYLSVHNVYFDVDEYYPVVTSAGSFTIGGLYYLDNSAPESNIKRRIK